MIVDSELRQAQPRTRRRWPWALAAFAVVVVIAIAILAWYTQTESFRQWAERKIVTAIEEGTGGKVELHQLTFSLRALRFQAEGLVVHGTEAADQEPYIRVQRIVIDAKVLSWAGRELALRSVLIDQPRVHVIVYPDGHTNVPAPNQASGSGANASQPVLNVKLDHAQLRDGVLLVNDRAIPFNFFAEGVRAAVNYAAKTRAYEGTASVASMHVGYAKLAPFDATGSAQFTLMPNRLQVRSLQLASGKISIDASGTVSDFANPRAEYQYVAQADVPQAASVFHLTELRRGTVHLQGAGTYAGDNFSTTGKATFSGVEYRDPTVYIPGIEGGAEYTADKSTLSVPHFFLHLLGGSATGNASVTSWQLPGKGQRGAVVAKVDNLSLARVTAAASTRKVPVESLRAAGSTSGTVNVSWRGSPEDARAQYAFTIRPGAAGAGELPVTGQVRGSYSVAAQRFDIGQFEANGRSMHAAVTGALGRNTNLVISASGTVADAAQVLRAWTGHDMLPLGLAGQGTFQGTITGRLNAPVIAGHLALTNIDVPLPLQLPAPAATVLKPVTAVAPPRANPPARTAHYDSASADIRYSPTELDIKNGVVTRGSEQATISAVIGLIGGRFYDIDPIQARLSARNFHVQDLAALGGYTPAVTGIVNGDADLHGTKDDPQGSARFQLTNATIYGAAVHTASASVRFADQKATFSDVTIVQDGGRITGNAEYNLQSTAFAFRLTGSNFHLAQIAQLQGNHVRTTGTLAFVARGSGTQSAPVIDADLNLTGLTINGQRVGDFTGTAKTTRGIMRVDARLTSELAGAEVEGTVVMRDGFAADLTLNISRLNAAPFLQMATSGRFTGQSTLGGAVHLAGPLKDPRSIVINGDLGDFSVSIENVKVQNDGPIRFTVKDGVLRLEQFKIAGTDTTMTARGSVEFSGSRALDFRADGRINLALAQSFNADLHAGGALDFNMRASGTILRPTLFGTVRVENGTVTSINSPVGISSVEGTLVFNQDRFQIRQLSGRVGGGDVSFGGFVSYTNGLSFDVTGKATDVRVRYPQGFSESVNGDLRLTGTRVSSTLTGQVTVVRFNVSPQFDMAVAIAAAKAPPTPPDPTSWLNNLRLNVKINSAPDLQLNTSLAKLSGDMSLTVRGTAIRPAVLGRINITEGQVSFNGATYQIDRGDISFSNPVKIEPIIDVAATTRVRDYDLTLGFHGPIDRLSTTYRSEPPLPTADIISLLAFGKTREESEMGGGASPTFSQSASSAIIGQALNAAVTDRVQRLFGVSHVRIAPDVTGVNATDPNARVTIEQQVSKDFTVTYITDLTRSNQQQSIQVEYNYNRNVSIIGSRDQYGIISFDVRWRKRKR